MTMLYRLDAESGAIGRTFAARPGADPWAGGHVSPGRFAPVITEGREFVAGPRPQHSERRMVPRLWGVPPPPSAGDPRRAVSSVRNVDSPFWIGNLRNSEFRCLVPATSFVEWGAGIDVEGRRIQHVYSLPGQPIFAFAAVWKDAEVPGFAILSCPANALLRSEGRETMPVILPPERHALDAWLSKGWDHARQLIAPYPADAMRKAELAGRYAS